MLLKQCNGYWGAVTWRSITKCRSHSQHWHTDTTCGQSLNPLALLCLKNTRWPFNKAPSGSPLRTAGKAVFPKLSSLQVKPVLVFCQLKGVDIIIWCNQETYPVHRHFKRHQQYFPTCVKINTKRLKSLMECYKWSALQKHEVKGYLMLSELEDTQRVNQLIVFTKTFQKRI